jgi:hypothetical protein
MNGQKWLGLAMLMDNRITERMFNIRPEGKRTGRPKLRWVIVWTMTSGFQERGNGGIWH